MKQTTSTSRSSSAGSRHLGSVPAPSDDATEDLDPVLARRAALRYRHTQGLAKLMGERRDLRGVHALADFVDDAVRWSA